MTLSGIQVELVPYVSLAGVAVALTLVVLTVWWSNKRDQGKGLG